MITSYSASSFDVSFTIANGDDLVMEAHDVDASLGPVPDEGYTGAYAFGDAFAVGDGTAVAGLADIAVAGGSVDAAVETVAYAEGDPDSFVFTSATTVLETSSSASAGVTISRQHYSYDADEAGFEELTVARESVVAVDPEASVGTSAPQLAAPAPSPLALDLEGVEGSTAVYDLEVSALGEDTFVSLDLSAFAIEDFSAITFVAVAEIA